MKGYIDLHTHTTASDGSDNPKEVVSKAAKLGLKAIAITDHDTLDGLEEAELAGLENGIEVIRGCELSVMSPYNEVHILGLWIPHQADELNSALSVLREHRARRNEIIVDKLQALGFEISYAEVLEEAVKKSKNSQKSIGRPHIAQVLLKKSYVADINEAFVKYIGINGVAFEPKQLFEVEVIFKLLSDVKATICIAHPGLIKCTVKELDSYIGYLKELGLFGIEAYHSEHSEKVTNELLRLAKKYDLGISGGSDYHGTPKPSISLGFGKGNLRIKYSVLEKLKARRRS